MIDIYEKIQSVYRMDNKTWQQVLAEFYNVVNSYDNNVEQLREEFKQILDKFSINLPISVREELDKLVKDGTIGNILSTYLPSEVSTEIEKLVSDGTLADIINNQLLGDINNKVNTATTELARITKQLVNSNIAYDGTECNDVDTRIEYEVVRLLDRFNRASYLPYEADYITANDSYEGKTRDNVVKGKTLQNLNEFGKSLTLKNGAKSFNGSLFIVNKEYTFITDISPYVGDGNVGGYAFDITYVDGTYDRIYNVSSWSNNEVKIREKLVIKKQVKTITCWNKSINNIIFSNNLILEGDYTNKPIPPYFEGIKSINEDGENLEEVSCGKNLFNIKTQTNHHNVTVEQLDNGFIAEGTWYAAYRLEHKLEIGKKYYLSFDKEVITEGDSIGTVIIHNLSQGKACCESFATSGVFTLNQYYNPNDNIVLLFYIGYGTKIGKIKFTNIQIEEGNLKTSYESYTEDRLPIKMKNLRSLPNGTCDTSDGVRRIGKIVLDGNEQWVDRSVSYNQDTQSRFSLSSVDNLKGKKGITLICDQLKVMYNCDVTTLLDNNTIAAHNSTDGYLYITTKKQNIEQFKLALQTNPITVYYELATPTKEEGNTEQLRIYDGTTNIFTENSLIEPTISCKVPSNVQAVVMNLREENKTLNNDVNTLQATTEENNLMNIETNVNQEVRLTMLEMGVI